MTSLHSATPAGRLRFTAATSHSTAVPLIADRHLNSGRTVWFSPGTPTLINKKDSLWEPFLFIGGEGGIRTHGTLARTPDFESGTFGHSVTSPKGRDYKVKTLQLGAF
jgi:hypothetical protein